MKLFRNIHLSDIDPLGAGLAEEIAHEQQESSHISLEDMPDGDELAREWQAIAEEAHGDPDYFFDEG